MRNYEGGPLAALIVLLVGWIRKCGDRIPVMAPSLTKSSNQLNNFRLQCRKKFADGDQRRSKGDGDTQERTLVVRQSRSDGGTKIEASKLIGI